MSDPKYHTGPITNVASGEIIPEDEPIFFFRARDILAVTVLEFYHELIVERAQEQKLSLDEFLDNEEHAAAVKARIEEFYAFRYNNPSRMKYPDTKVSNGQKN